MTNNKMIVQLVIWFVIFLVLIFYVRGHLPYKKIKCPCREGYADQIAHASVGGISGPMIDLGTYYVKDPVEEKKNKEDYMYFPHGTLPKGQKLIKRGMGLPFWNFTNENFPVEGGNGCSQICKNGYPRECPWGPKGCPYPCTGI